MRPGANRFLYSFLLVLLLVTTTPGADGLWIAAGQVDITAPAGDAMGGYGARKGVSTGSHDPLLAKVLLIKTKDQELALITLDLILFPSERVTREAKQMGIGTVLQIASHTHSGPVPKDFAKMAEDPWVQAVEGKILKIVREARSRYVPARLAVSETAILLGHNRRKVNADGSVTMFWRNAERLPTSPVDPRVGILRFNGADGKPLAVLVNYACHAVVLGPDNLQYSADWPGFMYRHVEEQLGAPAMVFFIPGAGGDINPFNDKQPVDQDGFAVARKVGEDLGDAVLAAMKRMPEGNAQPEIAVFERTYDFTDRFDPKRALPVRVAHLMFGAETGVLALPGEVFVRHQIDLREQSPLPHTFLFGYAYLGEGSFAGYIPTIQAAMEGGYGASYSTRIEVGAGERLVDDAVIRFGYRTGKLKDKPAQ
jgi:hypothetical protein